MISLRETAIAILKELRAEGYETFFAGGCVRDKFLRKEPKDYDIATSAQPEQVLKIFPQAQSIGAHFGVVLIRSNGFNFEVATFRTDGNYSDGRHPDTVSFGSALNDAMRRDFTINGLFENPLNNEIVDFIHGIADLEEKTIRTIGSPKLRFQEDGLRLMRAVRFATVLDFDIEPSTWAGIKEHIEMLNKVSVERIQSEFNKILLHSNRAKGLEMLVDSGLIKVFMPEVLEMIGCEQPPRYHPEGDVYTHTKIMLQLLKDEPSIELCLAVLLHDIGKPRTHSYDADAKRIRFNGHDTVGAEMSIQILKRLRYPNATIEAVTAMVENHMNFMHVRQMRKAKIKRFMARSTYQNEMELHRVDCASSNGITENYDFLREQEKAFAAEPLIPAPLISGRELISRGLTPGPQFRKILTALQTEQLEGSIRTKDEALEWLDKLLDQ